MTIREYLCREAQRITDRALTREPEAGDWERRRPELRRQFREMMGLDGLPDPANLPAPPVTVIGTVARPGYRIEKLYYESLPHLYVTANLYVPDALAAPAPAVLFQCGHAQKQKVHYQAHPRRFAQLGFVCLLIETVQLGEVAGCHHGPYREGWFHWYSRGYTPAGIELYNAQRALDLLAQRPERHLVRHREHRGRRLALRELGGHRVFAALDGEEPGHPQVRLSGDPGRRQRVEVAREPIHLRKVRGGQRSPGDEADALVTTSKPYDASAPVVGGWQGGNVQDVSIGLRDDGASSALSLYAEDGSVGEELRTGAVTVGSAYVVMGESGAGGTRARLNGGDWAIGSGSRDDLRIEGVGRFGGSRWLDGRIYALVAIGRALGDAEADGLARWIAGKAGVAL